VVPLAKSAAALGGAEAPEPRSGALSRPLSMAEPLEPSAQLA